MLPKFKFFQEQSIPNIKFKISLKVDTLVFLNNYVSLQCSDEWGRLLMMRVDELDRSGCEHHAASASPACLSVGRSPVITGPLLQ